MFVTSSFNRLRIWHTTIFMDLFMNWLRTEFHVLSSSGSLIINMKPKAIHEHRLSSCCKFYKKIISEKVAFFRKSVIKYIFGSLRTHFANSHGQHVCIIYERKLRITQVYPGSVSYHANHKAFPDFLLRVHLLHHIITFHNIQEALIDQ